MTGGEEFLAGGYHLWRVSRGCSSTGRKKRYVALPRDVVAAAAGTS